MNPSLSFIITECGAFSDIDNGYFILTDPKERVVGATAELKCYDGYFVSGPTTIDCTVNADWSNPSGTCEAKG